MTVIFKSSHLNSSCSPYTEVHSQSWVIDVGSLSRLIWPVLRRFQGSSLGLPGGIQSPWPVGKGALRRLVGTIRDTSEAMRSHLGTVRCYGAFLNSQAPLRGLLENIRRNSQRQAFESQTPGRIQKVDPP